jgi:hypothetical protein
MALGSVRAHPSGVSSETAVARATLGRTTTIAPLRSDHPGVAATCARTTRTRLAPLEAQHTAYPRPRRTPRRLAVQAQAARDPATLAAMRQVERVLQADGDQRKPFRDACEQLRVALVQHAIRHTIRATPVTSNTQSQVRVW